MVFAKIEYDPTRPADLCKTCDLTGLMRNIYELWQQLFSSCRDAFPKIIDNIFFWYNQYNMYRL